MLKYQNFLSWESCHHKEVEKHASSHERLVTGQDIDNNGILG